MFYRDSYIRKLNNQDGDSPVPSPGSAEMSPSAEPNYPTKKDTEPGKSNLYLKYKEMSIFVFVFVKFVSMSSI